ncbi:MAG: hemerythrin family protein [Deltaproteobacteria bacterium]|nr:hemerythrin family protein [Deltaproteobacteria bacterium]
MPQWDPLMDTGIDRVDRDHQRFVEKLNELGQAMKVGKGRETMADLLAFLNDYVREHFGYEEALMKRCGYPGYEEHRAIHERFKKDLATRAAAFAQCPDDRLITIEIHGWLMSWLSEHALNVDAKVGDYLRNHPELQEE